MPQTPFPIDGFKLVAFCPLCNAKYNPSQAEVLEHKEDAHLVFVQCSNCGSSIIALVVAGMMGVSSIGLVTDLMPADIEKFKHLAPINADDVLDIHHTLQEKHSLSQLM